MSDYDNLTVHPFFTLDRRKDAELSTFQLSSAPETNGGVLGQLDIVGGNKEAQFGPVKRGRGRPKSEKNTKKARSSSRVIGQDAMGQNEHTRVPYSNLQLGKDVSTQALFNVLSIQTGPADTRQYASRDSQDLPAIAAYDEEQPQTPSKHTTNPSVSRSRRSSVQLSGGEKRSSPTEAIGEPPRKMIKVRADGRLSSPTGSAGVIGKRRRGRNRHGPLGANERKIVVMRYGRDDVSRRAIAAKVDEILCLAGPKFRHVTPTPKALQLNLVVKADLPSKCTHPFFLGKPQGASSTQLIQGRAGEQIGVSSTGTAEQEPTTRSNSGPVPVRQRVQGTISRGLQTWRPSSLSKSSKIPGAKDPLWPARDMQHVRGDLSSLNSQIFDPKIMQRPRKLKATVQEVVPQQYVLRAHEDFVRSWKEATQNNAEAKTYKNLFLPQRRIMTTSEVHSETRQRIKQCSFTSQKLLRDLGNARSPFDRFECYAQSWLTKYAPLTTEEVLQDGDQITSLRDWLRSKTVNSVGTAAPIVSKAELKERKEKTRIRKRRKTAQGLDDFVISDEDTDGCTDLEDENTGTNGHRFRSLSKTITSKTNAVIIQGPHGCGKTAAVYAIAKDLGFEVFEINAGTRRSGADVLARIGDMTENHLVRRDLAEDGVSIATLGDNAVPLPDEDEDQRQTSLSGFFKTKALSKPRIKKKEVDKSTAEGHPKAHSKSQKQSLILLEEVGILFEEDKGFWNTVESLIRRTRRPIVMTCTNASSVLVEDSDNCALLTMRRPSTELASEHLVLIAALEGHLISQKAAASLYRSRNQDLRASLLDLDFFCQLGLGDRKGGIDWMLKPEDKSVHSTQEDSNLRVLSESTFHEKMNVLGHQDAASISSLNHTQIIRTIQDAARDWGYEVDDTVLSCGPLIPDGPMHSSQSVSFEHLRTLELCCDAMSAADVLPKFGFRHGLDAWLDPSTPILATKDRKNFVEGPSLLSMESQEDRSGLEENIFSSLKVFASKLGADDPQLSFVLPKYDIPTLSESAVKQAPTLGSMKREMTRLLTSLDVLREPSKTTIAYNGPRITSFDGTVTPIVVDIAPFVRSIASFDLVLEHRRAELENLLSEGGRQGKKQRTTRASRAALEGGNKASTRRERWFPKELDLPQVLRTGSPSWRAIFGSALMRNMSCPLSSAGESRRSSSGSADALTRA